MNRSVIPTPCQNIHRHTHPMKLGCSQAAHRELGWCSGVCSPHTTAEEAIGWRILHTEYEQNCDNHVLVQHRDRKPPWCHKCGCDGTDRMIGKVRSWMKP